MITDHPPVNHPHKPRRARFVIDFLVDGRVREYAITATACADAIARWANAYSALRINAQFLGIREVQ